MTIEVILETKKYAVLWLLKLLSPEEIIIEYKISTLNWKQPYIFSLYYRETKSAT